ncbi:hypothetical protein Q7P35_002842 [Cladosporium inversicolor]
MSPQKGDRAPTVVDSSLHSPLVELPAELLHNVFAHLDLQGVLAARKTCTTLASVGIDHFGDEVALVYHREKFKALTQIAEHPILAKRMRSLFYLVDRFKARTYEVWHEDRVTGDPLNVTKYLAEATGTDDNAEVKNHDSRAVTAALEARDARLAAVPKKDLLEGYHKFLAVCHDQTEINEELYDSTCLQSFFQGCCKIRDVTIASRIHCGRDLGALDSAFSRTMVRPTEDKTWSDAGVDQLHALVNGIQRDGLELDSLTIAGISHMIFEVSSDQRILLWGALKDLVRPLRRLRLLIQAWPPEDYDSSEEEESSGSGTDSDEDPEKGLKSVSAIRLRGQLLFEEGPVYGILSGARELRVLKLELPQWDPTGEPDYIRIDHALLDVHFPHLYELALSQCAVMGDWFVDFLLRHKATLRRLSISNMSLVQARPSWREVFTRMSCQMPHLQTVNIHGAFHREDRPSVFFNHQWSTESKAYNRAMEEFILRGGKYPTHTSARRRASLSGADEDHYYPQRVLSNSDTLSDDPALDYEPDEYDEWFIR